METKKRTFCDVLINIIYVMAMAMERMIRVTEILMLREKHEWKYEKKMRFNEIIKCIKRIKSLNDAIDQDEYAQACEGRGEFYQYYQEDAYKLCRFILFFCDRDTVSEELSNETFKLMRSQKGTGEIDEEEDMKWFYLNK